MGVWTTDLELGGILHRSDLTYLRSINLDVLSLCSTNPTGCFEEMEATEFSPKHTNEMSYGKGE